MDCNFLAATILTDYKYYKKAIFNYSEFPDVCKALITMVNSRQSLSNKELTSVITFIWDCPDNWFFALLWQFYRRQQVFNWYAKPANKRHKAKLIRRLRLVRNVTKNEYNTDFRPQACNMIGIIQYNKV